MSVGYIMINFLRKLMAPSPTNMPNSPTIITSGGAGGRVPNREYPAPTIRPKKTDKKYSRMI